MHDLFDEHYEVIYLESYTKEEAINKIIDYYTENEDDFISDIEELDGWNGYLGDDRYYNMDELDDFFRDQEPTEILFRAFYGHDANTKEEFNPNREFFQFNAYGNLVSSDYKDYFDRLDEYFVENLIDNYTHLNISDDVVEIIESINE